MATAEEIEKLFTHLKSTISGMKLMVEASGDLAKVLTNAEKKLDELKTDYLAIKANNGDMTEIEIKLRGIETALSLIVDGRKTVQGAAKGRFEYAIAALGQSAPGFGIAALGLAFLFTLGAVAVTVLKMGSPSWQTIAGGRAVLLMALTFGFITFGGALLITPLFAEGALEDRFRRSREIFLLFAGMFSTVVGFYFASATNPFLGSELLIAETFDTQKAELQVAVAGGKNPYAVEVEYGEKEAVKRKPVASLDAAGTVNFSFMKESEWPTPMTIKVKDSENAKNERRITLQKEELLAAGFKEPKKGPKPEEKSVDASPKLTVTPNFDMASGIVEVIAKGGKPPYKIEAIYGKEKSRKALPDITDAEGSTKFTFDKAVDWPLPLTISVKDSAGKTFDQAVTVDESLLLKGGFKKQ